MTPLELTEFKIIKEHLPENVDTKSVLAKIGCIIELMQAQEEFQGKVTDIKKKMAEL